jgi:peptide-methionine (S)-S-oxide reductase
MITLSSSSGFSRRGLWRVLVCALVTAVGTLLWESAAHSEDAVAIPPAAQDEAPGTSHMEKAVLAGGCFWGVQGVFQHVQGVERVVAGYAGGTKDTAQYETVGSGRTGHAESVEITFDPTRISYGTVLQIFFSVAHNPTELNRQGPDSGPQYRSAIFPATPEQHRVAQTYIAQLDASHVFAGPIATRIEDDGRFYPAEDYHQDFLAQHPNYPYIVINDLPKIEQLKHLFPTRYREQAVLVKSAS